MLDSDSFRFELQERKRFKDSESQDDLYQMANEMLCEIDENGDTPFKNELDKIDGGVNGGVDCVVKGEVNGIENGGTNGQHESGHLNGGSGNLIMPTVNRSYNQQIINGHEYKNIIGINGILEHRREEEMGDVGFETSKVQRKLDFN